MASPRSSLILLNSVEILEYPLAPL